jgi:hypothetical protein
MRVARGCWTARGFLSAPFSALLQKTLSLQKKHRRARARKSPRCITPTPTPQNSNAAKWGDVEFPLPFGRTMTKAEQYVASLDEATGALRFVWGRWWWWRFSCGCLMFALGGGQRLMLKKKRVVTHQTQKNNT